jgi:hypothetical protein
LATCVSDLQACIMVAFSHPSTYVQADTLYMQG